MKTIFAILFLFAIAWTAPEYSGQSRRVPPGSTSRPNDRESPPQPAATPTPTPDSTDPGAEDNGDVISVDTKLVTIPVRVLDRKNRFIGGLERQNFTIFEDGVEQELAYFTNEAQPFTVALVLDMSYSSTFKIEEIQNAAIAFIDQLRPEDRVMVISFDEEVHMLSEPTSDRKRINAAIRSTRISTGTSLYEAVDLTMNARMRSIQGRKAIVLFTDGVDTTSRRAHDRDNLSDAMELDALIYPIRYDTFADVQAMKNRSPIGLPGGSTVPGLPPGVSVSVPTRGGTTRGRNEPRSEPTTYPRNDPTSAPPSSPPVSSPSQRGTTVEEYRFAEEFLSQLALRTGGRVHQASSLSNLNSAFAKIASELREFYSIGYYPTDPGSPGKTRRIKVKVNQPEMVVRARDSYVVPR